MSLRVIQSSNPLVKRVTVANWGLLGVTLALQTVVVGVQFSPSVVHKVGVCLAVLTMLSLLSIYWPLNRGRHWRFVVCSLELFLLAVASFFGIYRWIAPLYLVQIARASLLLDQEDLPTVVVASCIAQFVWYFLHALVNLPPHVGLSQLVATSMISGLMMTASSCVLVMVVAVLMRSLVSEQQLRQETERLGRENEILATELERTRIAREIHDTVGHSLTSLKIQLELANRLIERGDDQARAAVAQAEQLAARSLTDTRVALQSIRNTDFNFEKALDELVRELRSSGAVEVAVECENFPIMSNAVSYQLYRVIQECMTNTLKHAQAKRIVVSLHESEGSVKLEVKDDGKGFESGATTDGFGLKGLRERISSLRGEVLVQSKSGDGTCVNVTVPLG